MTYNLLSKELAAEHLDLYQSCAPEVLLWENRSRTLLAELACKKVPKKGKRGEALVRGVLCISYVAHPYICISKRPGLLLLAGIG